MRPVVATCAVLFFVTSAAARVAAQSPETGRPAAPAIVKRAHAVRSDRPPRIDGRLDDAVWQSAVFLDDFTQRDPIEGAPASDRTEIAFAWDDAALYVGARMYSSDPAGVQALVTRRDREGLSEQLVVSLDTYRDRLTAYTFAVTAAGVRVDYYHARDAEGSRDYSYEPVWEARTAIDEDGWTAEIRIPFTQLRFSRAGEQTWGVNVVRLTPWRNERAYWVLVGRDETGWSSRMGELTGITDVRPSRRIEAMPYIAGEATRRATFDAANPFAERSNSAFRAGGDLKAGLGPAFTLDATFNPDFGQVEADPAEVNLSAFETFFAERRPFFTEGTQLFAGRGNFYSRRIGAPPLRPSAPYVDVAANTTILAAAKVAGRLPSGFSAGVLTAVTGREDARTFDPESGAEDIMQAAPLTGFGVVSLQQAFGASQSTASLMLTAVERDIDNDSFLAPLLARRALTGLADVRIRWAGGQYDVSSYVGVSHLQGNAAAILAQQLSSRRYFQRPDADYVGVDPQRTTMTGYSFGINHSRMSGRHWLWDIDYALESPEFELNDLGRLGNTDEHVFITNLRYRENAPGSIFRSYEVGLFQLSEWNFGRVRQFTFASIYGGMTWRNFWTTNFEVGANPRGTSDNLTRGGPLMGTAAGVSVNASLSNAPSSKHRWRVNVSAGDDELGGWNVNLGGGLTLRPTPRWEVAADPRVVRGVASRQFVLSRDGGSAATFDRRYIFGHLERHELALRLRLNYALTPELTFESYAEPFASAGRFHDFGELVAARSRHLRTYGQAPGTTITQQDDGSALVTDGASSFTIPNRDFDVRSLRSNIVLRWEWRPGSTAFLVWQQNRAAAESRFRALGPSSLGDAVNAPGDNFVAVKFSYWLPIR